MVLVILNLIIIIPPFMLATCTVLFSIRAICFAYRPITGKYFHGTLADILYPWFFYEVGLC